MYIDDGKSKKSSSSSSSSKTSSSTSNRDSNPTKASTLTDEELVDLLRKPPKSVAVLRTKASFQEFFRGVDAIRFQRLIQQAYSDIIDSNERDAKIKRRMELMDGVLN